MDGGLIGSGRPVRLRSLGDPASSLGSVRTGDLQLGKLLAGGLIPTESEGHLRERKPAAIGPSPPDLFGASAVPSPFELLIQDLDQLIAAVGVGLKMPVVPQNTVDPSPPGVD